MCNGKDSDENYFRNTAQINDIEPQSLWKLEGKTMVLVDDDEYRTVDYEKYTGYFVKAT